MGSYWTGKPCNVKHVLHVSVTLTDLGVFFHSLVVLYYSCSVSPVCRHVVLGFSRCGQLLLSYSCELDVTATHSTYTLHWWTFLLYSPLQHVSTSNIICTFPYLHHASPPRNTDVCPSTCRYTVSGCFEVRPFLQNFTSLSARHLHQFTLWLSAASECHYTITCSSTVIALTMLPVSAYFPHTHTQENIHRRLSSSMLCHRPSLLPTLFSSPLCLVTAVLPALQV